MQKILSKRVFRDLKSNFLRYLALFFLIVLGMYIVISLIAAAETIITGVEEKQSINRLEDGQFSVFLPLSDESLTELRNAGADIEESFFLDYELEDESTIRVYRNRANINLIDICEGRLAVEEDEVLLEQRYASVHNLKLGNSIEIGGNTYTIVGLGSTPDYDAMYQNMSDTSVDHDAFGNAFVCETAYDKLKAENKSKKAETYTYSYILNGALTDDALKEMVKEYAGDTNILTSFVKSADNPRHGASIEDVQINKDAGLLAGVIVMILFTYVISVFVIHSIEKECMVIGALYALGVKSRQLMLHYLMLPVTITFLGGVVGTLLGFSPIGTKVQMQESLTYFSLPTMTIQYPPYLIIYGIIMPPIIAAIVNYFVINSNLKRTALSMLKNEQKSSKIKDINLGNIGFVQRFQIRQMLRELRSGITVILGMFLALLLLMLGMDCYTLCKNYQTNMKNDTTFAYMYTLKYPEENFSEQAGACYIETLKMETFGYKFDVMILGIDGDNKYFDVQTEKNQNEIVISEAVASKFHVETGDKLVLSDDVNNREYVFTVKDITAIYSGMYTFMDIDAMHALFNRDENYYNVIFSDEALDISSDKLYATTSRQELIKSSNVFLELMHPLIRGMICISIIIFVIVMYLMMKVMIDRSSFSIALMKIFGYRKREIKKLYLDGNFMIVAIGAVICLPLSKRIMDAMYPYLVSNVNIALDLRFSAWLYVLIYLGVIICYLIINQLLTGRLKKMVPAEILKNRE